MNNLGKRMPADFPSDTQHHWEVIASSFLSGQFSDVCG